LLETTETKIDSADLYWDTSKLSILIVGSPALALGLQFSIYAEAAQRNSRFQRRSQARGLLFGLMAAFAIFPGCGGGGASSGSSPPPPPAVTVSVTPPSGNVLLGKTLQLTAAVTGTEPERKWHRRRKRGFRNHLSGRNLYRPHGLTGSCICENCSYSRKKYLIV